MSTNIAYPYATSGRGRTATADDPSHLRDLIEQVLFTSPGERVNRPDFGCGLLQLVFAPNSAEVAAATQFLVQSALQQWLGDVLVAESVDIAVDDASLRVTVRYILRRTGEAATVELSR
jgi:uncharacterized protein